MKKIYPRGPVTPGIDIYHGDHVVDPITLVRGGVVWAMLKASEGASMKDNMFRSRWQNFKQAGILVGGYHFFHPSIDPIVQANNFLSQMASVNTTSTDMPCSIDWESTDGVPASSDVKSAVAFINRVESVLKKRLIVYAGPYFLDALKKFMPQSIANRALWVAHYGTAAPLVPDPWTDWTFWQSRDTFTNPAWGHGDSDSFNGSKDDLLKFIAASHLV